MKSCLYDLTFYLGEKEIKPTLMKKKDAKKYYKESIEMGYSSLIGMEDDNGISMFKIGNLNPNEKCKVIFKFAFMSILNDESSILTKLSLDIIRPYGSEICSTSGGSILFTFISKQYDEILEIKSNIESGVSERINENEVKYSFEVSGYFPVIDIITKVKNPIKSIAVGNGKFAVLSMIGENVTRNELDNEYIFLVDCSGSMDGSRIKFAIDCMKLFIHSLPEKSHFNIYRFGSSYDSLFPESEDYNEENLNKAIEYISYTDADYGGTEIFQPLNSIFKQNIKYSTQRQVFILTDGEVSDTSSVLNLVEENNGKNRCFSVGLGKGADAGLVEGIASRSYGKASFVFNNNELDSKIMDLLESSFSSPIKEVEVFIENEENIEVSPYPIPPIFMNNVTNVFISTSNEINTSQSLMVSGSLLDSNIDIPINIINDNTIDCLPQLFAYNNINQLYNSKSIDKECKSKIVTLSISSGILSKYTAYIGISPVEQKHYKYSSDMSRFDYGFCAVDDFAESELECEDTFKACDECFEGFSFSLSSEPIESNKEQIPNKKDEYSVIVSFQKFDGSWDSPSDLLNILQKQIEIFSELSDIENSIKERAFATILAISILRERCAESKDSWKLVERKALNWLQNNLKGKNLDDLISKAISQIK